MMKNQLLLLFALFTTVSSMAQVPSNNLLENATLINSFPFSDTGIRLDLATASSISPSGCNIGNYNLVYYKFIAAESSQLDVTLEDANDTAIGQSFVMVYSAPSLNITDDTQLSLISSCVFGSSVSIGLEAGTNYYVLVHRNDANALSNILIDANVVLPVPDSEMDALTALYNSTNGDSWTDNTNWNSDAPVESWYGVTTAVFNGVRHIKRLNLGGNNLTGYLPPEIGDFPELTNLLLWANQLTGNIPPEIGNLTNLVEMDLAPNTFSGSIPVEIGNLVNLEILWLNQNGLSGNIPSSFQNLVNLRELYLRGAVGTNSEWSASSYSGDFPDLTALPLEILQIQDNFFHFEDIQNEFAAYQANIPNFIFNPQYTVDPPEEITAEVGDDIILNLTDISETERNTSNSLTTNHYQWFKNSVQIDGANESSYTIVNAQNSDSGIYHCEITNPDVPGYIVRRSSIDVNVGTLNIPDNLMDSINLYPNPVRDNLNISVPNGIEVLKIEVFNLLGEMVTSMPLNKNFTVWDCSQLQSGIYLLKFISEDLTTTKKLIKK